MDKLAKKDQIILVDVGEGTTFFDDIVICRVKKDFDPIKEMNENFIREYKSEHKVDDDHINYAEFFDWLVENEFIEEIKLSGLYINDRDKTVFYPSV